MPLLKDATELTPQGSMVTLKQVANIKHTSVDALRAWLRAHPEVRLHKVGSTIVVDLNAFDKYVTRY
jgi:hypothetical protein